MSWKADISRDVIVTGAHGFIGRYVSKFLSLNGWKVIGIGHGEWLSDKEQEEWGISIWISSDISVQNLVDINVTPDAIVHCAGSGSVGFSIEKPLEDFERNVNTVANVLDYARKHSPSARVIILSSAAVYGDVTHFPIFEKSNLNPASPYGAHKKIAEDLCKSFSDNYGLNITVLRLFSVYGSGLRKQLLWDACNKIAKNNYEFFGTGDELRDWVHVTDIASLVFCVLGQEIKGFTVINGASGNGAKVRDVLISLFRSFGEIDNPVFSGITKPGDPLGFIADITKSRNLGWVPNISLEQGIVDYANWYKDIS